MLQMTSRKLYITAQNYMIQQLYVELCSTMKRGDYYD